MRSEVRVVERGLSGPPPGDDAVARLGRSSGLVRDRGAPVDEYAPEVDALLKESSPISRARVHAVLAAMFGDEVEDLSADDAAAIARRIDDMRRKLGFSAT